MMLYETKMDEYFGTLLSTDPKFFPLTRPTTFKATQATVKSPNKVEAPSILN